MRRTLLAACPLACTLVAGPAAGATTHQADAGFMVLSRPSPLTALAPGPGVWQGLTVAADAPNIVDLAGRYPRARLRVGQTAVVRLPFDAASAAVRVLRPRRARINGDLALVRTTLFSQLRGRDVSWRVSGTAGILVVQAVDAAGRGTASGRFVGRLAGESQCRGWTGQLRRLKDRDGDRADALRTLLLERCVSPIAVPRAR